MLLQKAKELVDQKNFSQAFEELQKFLESNNQDPQLELDAYRQLSNLPSLKVKENRKTYFTKYFSLLEKEKNYEEIYTFIKKMSLEKDFNYVSYFINSLRHLGKINDFKKELTATIEMALARKLYNQLPKLIELANEAFIDRAYLIQIETQYYLELGNVIKLNGKLNSFLSNFIKSPNLVKSPVNCIQGLLKILNKAQTPIHADIQYRKLQLKFLMKVLTEYELSKKLEIEFLLMARDEVDFLLLLNASEEKPLYIQVLKEKFGTTSRSLPGILSKLKHHFSNEITLMKSATNQSRENFNLSPDSFKFESKSYTADHVLVPEKPKICDAEKKVLNFIKFDEQKLEHLPDMVSSYINMEYFFVAMELLKKAPESISTLYLQAEVSLKLMDYPDVIYYVNTALNTLKETNTPEALPMLYLKGLAYEQMDKRKEALESFRLVAKIDPEFRRVKSKLLE